MPAQGTKLLQGLSCSNAKNYLAHADLTTLPQDHRSVSATQPNDSCAQFHLDPTAAQRFQKHHRFDDTHRKTPQDRLWPNLYQAPKNPYERPIFWILPTMENISYKRHQKTQSQDPALQKRSVLLLTKHSFSFLTAFTYPDTEKTQLNSFTSNKFRGATGPVWDLSALVHYSSPAALEGCITPSLPPMAAVTSPAHLPHGTERSKYHLVKSICWKTQSLVHQSYSQIHGKPLPKQQ